MCPWDKVGYFSSPMTLSPIFDRKLPQVVCIEKVWTLIFMMVLVKKLVS